MKYTNNVLKIMNNIPNKECILVILIEKYIDPLIWPRVWWIGYKNINDITKAPGRKALPRVNWIISGASGDKEQQKIVDSAIEKKLSLSKLMANIMSKTLDSKGVDGLDGDIREALAEMLNKPSEDKKDSSDTTVNYKL